MPDNFWESLSNAFSSSWQSFIRHLPQYLVGLLIIVAGILISNGITKGFRRAVSRRSNDPLMTNFLAKSIKLVLIVLVILIGLRAAGFGGIAAGLLTTAGASAIILGFAFRDIGENFISGVILSFNRPFDVNDTVQIGDVFGKVKAMEFRYTKIKTFDGQDVYIPNSDIIKKAVFNYTEDGFLRLDFSVGIDYDDDIETASQIVLKTIHDTTDVVEDSQHETFVVVDNLDTNTVVLKAYFWVNTTEYRHMALLIRSKAIKAAKEALAAAGISMPANIQEIKLYRGQQNVPFVMQKEA